jgi:hypothetical protein
MLPANFTFGSKISALEPKRQFVAYFFLLRSSVTLEQHLFKQDGTVCSFRSRFKPNRVQVISGITCVITPVL